MKTIATINFKGGIGKTTVTWCLGDVLSKHSNANVLLFDLDAQGSLTQSIAVQDDGGLKQNFDSFRNADNTIYHAVNKFLEPNAKFNFDVADNFIYQISGNYNFVPSVDELYWMELQQFELGKEFFIKKLLGQIENNKNLPPYDYVLFDCPPSFTFLSYSVLTCCDLILIPVNADFFAAKGVDILLRVLKEKIQPHPLPHIAVFANRVRTWRNPTSAARGWIEGLKTTCKEAEEKLGINVSYLDSWIPDRAAIRDAITKGKTPRTQVSNFINLWNEARGKLK